MRASLRPQCAEEAGPKARGKRRDVRNENEKKVVRVRDDFFLLFVPRFSYFCAATSAIWRLKLVIIWLAFFPIYNYSIRVCECGGGVALLLAFSFFRRRVGGEEDGRKLLRAFIITKPSPIFQFFLLL